MGAQALSPTTQEAEAGESLKFEFSLVYRVSSWQDSKGYTEKPCLKQNKTKLNKTKHNPEDFSLRQGDCPLIT